MVVSWASWLHGLDLAETIYFDATHVRVGDKMAVVLSLVQRSANFKLMPIAIGTADDESISKIETFLDFIFGVSASLVGKDYKVGTKYRLPRLKVVMADGIPGFSVMMNRLFEDRIRRASCYFHICQSFRRSMIRDRIQTDIQSYFEEVLHVLSMCETLPEFLYTWSVFRNKFLEKDGFDKNVVRTVIDYFEKQYLSNPDSNLWCRAIIEVGGMHLEQGCSGTISESFNHCLKRCLPPSFPSFAKLGTFLAENVGPRLHDSFRTNFAHDQRREIPPEHWHEAQVLAKLIQERYEGFETDRLAPKMAFSIDSGAIYSLTDLHDSSIEISWDFKPDGKTPIVQFKNASAHGLLKWKFNILQIDNVEDRSWFLNAKCDCHEFVCRNYSPCRHILAIYLLYNRGRLDQEEMKKLLNDTGLTQRIKKVAAEESKKTGDRLRLRDSGIGSDFIRLALIGDDAEIARQRLEDKDIIKSFTSGKMASSDLVKSSDITHVLRSMRDDILRSQVMFARRRKNKIIPLPSYDDYLRSPKATRQPARKRKAVSTRVKVDKPKSANKRAVKMTKSRSGRHAARIDLASARPRSVRACKKRRL